MSTVDTHSTLSQTLGHMAPMLLIGSAYLVGLIHSLSPGHWLPVVLTARARKWGMGQTALGGVLAASGHVFVSLLVALLTVAVGEAFFSHYESEIERFSGIGLIFFGLLFAGLALKRHRGCDDHAHAHHGPKQTRTRSPYWFLVSVGLAPCVAVIPVIVAASGHGVLVLAGSVLGFILGVLSAFIGASVLVSRGLIELDHPWLEHNDDVITGVAVAALGLVLFLIG